MRGYDFIENNYTLAMADFKEFYHTDLQDELLKNKKNTYFLAGELGRSSRYFEFFNGGPDFDNTDYMLTMIEFWTHSNAWSKTKDAQRMKNKPELNLPEYINLRNSENSDDFEDLSSLSEKEIYEYIYKGREENIGRSKINGGE